MRKKHRRQSSFPWPVLAFMGVLLIVAAFWLANRNGQAGGGTPEIAVDQSRIDYGYVKFGNNESFKIKVTNSGTGVLRFAQKPYIEILEGC